MIIPVEQADRDKFLEWLLSVCTASLAERRTLYAKRRRFYLYGQDEQTIVRMNRLKAHFALLSSFCFAADQASYTVAAPKNASDIEIGQFLAIEDEWNETFRDSGLADAFDQALTWAFVYDSMIVKQGWNDVTDDLFADLVEPACFGVAREDRPFAAQQAFVHSYVIDYDDAVSRMLRAGRAQEVDKLRPLSGGSSDTGLPGPVNQMIISATGGADLGGRISGEINPNYQASPTYSPKLTQQTVEFHEVWVWDEHALDWRIFHMGAPDLVLADSKETIAALKRNGGSRIRPTFASDTNFFLEKEHPFTMVTPYPLYQWIWGDCHLEDLIPLQVWSNERLEQIDEILQKQVDPAKSFSGFNGIDDERAEAFGGPGTFMMEQTPNAKVEVHEPTIPEDLFREFDSIGQLFMEQSGFTEMMAGRGEKNVRGRGHARELKTTGGGRVRKVAAGLEKPLVRLGDVGLKLAAKNDNSKLRAQNGMEFGLAQVLGNDRGYSVRISGHSHSPLFTMESQELAFALFKAGAADREDLVRLLRPANEAAIIHKLRQRMKAEAERAARTPPGQAPAKGK